jgi:DNA-binding PadR family transcriptional regulator
MADAPLTPAVFHIALVLAAGPRHGYAIMQRTGELGFILGPGTLYRSLQKMRVKSWIVEIEADDFEDERRRKYALTERGRQVVVVEAKRLGRLLAAARANGLLEDE